MTKEELIAAIAAACSFPDEAEVPEKVILLAVERLLSFFPLEELSGEVSGISCAIRKTEQDLKNETNRNDVPKGLYFVWSDRVTGEVLKDMGSRGKTPSFLSSDNAVKAVTAGDTRVEFASASAMTDKQKYDVLILKLAESGKGGEVLRYRQLQW